MSCNYFPIHRTSSGYLKEKISPVNDMTVFAIIQSTHNMTFKTAKHWIFVSYFAECAHALEYLLDIEVS